jgi:hypothetical protein
MLLSFDFADTCSDPYMCAPFILQLAVYLLKTVQLGGVDISSDLVELSPAKLDSSS